MEHVRRELRFSGRVQGVGFRFTTRTIARPFAVTGFVQNLSDGCVQLVVEGAAAEIEDFLQRLEQSVGHLVKHQQQTDLAATGEFDQFEIRY